MLFFFNKIKIVICFQWKKHLDMFLCLFLKNLYWKRINVRNNVGNCYRLWNWNMDLRYNLIKSSAVRIGRVIWWRCTIYLAGASFWNLVPVDSLWIMNRDERFSFTGLAWHIAAPHVCIFSLAAYNYRDIMWRRYVNVEN